MSYVLFYNVENSLFIHYLYCLFVKVAEKLGPIPMGSIHPGEVANQSQT